ncbi:amidohydrolase [Urbifossiella limnaea]|uniref:Glucuronate isomerase n=1 Tax=Urbifossiella limnaea TaxID=2528023 RepID=A0A517Y0S5_9BACT|nr:amidohydrolase [Urbifossiella limnaea]QDU23362.1 glucuronate isomerase [Urbifossiella limnaea]
MPADQLVADLTAALDAIPLIDPHSHIDPLAPVSKSLDDILGYHYYTELAHSAGMSQEPLGKDVSPRDRVRAIVGHMDRYDNTAQYRWFLDIARTFLGYDGTRITAGDADKLLDAAETTFAQPDWEKQVFAKTKLEKIFLTNEFDDPLEGFDTNVYVPCLRTDSLVFQLDRAETRERLFKATGVQLRDAGSLRKALATLFLHFTRKGAKACAISLPPDFEPAHYDDEYLYEQIRHHDCRDIGPGVFWLIAELCRDFKLPFDLMIGVNRRVYVNGVHQGQDLFDQRTSLIQYKRVFNAFPEVTFPVSVLTSAQNQELVAYSWIFPNVVPNGHWWYSNVPPYIRKDLGERLSAVPKTKLIGYYSDAYKLEFVLPKYAMYRRILATTLADDFVRPGVLSEAGAVALGTRLLRDNVRDTFKV